MRNEKVNTSYNMEPTAGVEMSDELITEQTGYRSTKQIVEGMILAGQRLEDYRHGRLDEFLEENYQEPIERYERDPVEEEADIVRKLRYRSVRNEKVEKTETEASGDEAQKNSEETVQKAIDTPAE